MSWWAVLALCASAYGLKALGLVVAQRSTSTALAGDSLQLLIVPVLAALIVVQTLDAGRALVLDARAPALAVAALLVWRRAPILVVVLATGVTAAVLRLV